MQVSKKSKGTKNKVCKERWPLIIFINTECITIHYMFLFFHFPCIYPSTEIMTHEKKKFVILMFLIFQNPCY